MDYTIYKVAQYKTFWEFMPETYQGNAYELDGDWDYDAERFIPEYFQLCDGDWEIQKGYCPADLLQYVEKACKVLTIHHEEMGYLEEEEWTKFDHDAAKADKEYYERN